MKIIIKRDKIKTITTELYCCSEMSKLMQESDVVAIHLQANKFKITKINPADINFCPYCGREIYFEETKI